MRPRISGTLSGDLNTWNAPAQVFHRCVIHGRESAGVIDHTANLPHSSEVSRLRQGYHQGDLFFFFLSLSIRKAEQKKTT